MVVTYLGNSLLTWRGEGDGDRRREVVLFVVFNLIGLGLSVLTLTISHDVLGLTSRLADNISANGVGLALGTLFRYWSYKTFVFAPPGAGTSPIPVGESPSWSGDDVSTSPGKAGNQDFKLTRLEKIRP